MRTLVDHMESFLGRIECGWKDVDGAKWQFQIIKCCNGLIPMANVYATFGLSEHQLWSASLSEYLQQECILAVHSTHADRTLPAVLQQVAMEAVSRGEAYLRGDVLGPRGAIYPGSQMEAFYVALPVYFPDDFASFSITDHATIVFAWLVPIFRSEAEFVKANGWRNFEEQLQLRNPDLLDLNRQPIM